MGIRKLGNWDIDSWELKTEKSVCMKKIIWLLGYRLPVALFISSCKEVGPDINLHGNEHAFSDTSYVETPVADAELKNVVVEEFTGVRCPNCPQGHVIIANIKAANPGRVVAVSLHPENSLGRPYSFSNEDFQNDKAQSLFDYLVPVGFEPAAAIDRKLFSGQNYVLLDKGLWSNYVSQQIAEVPPVNLLLSKTYDSTTRQLTVVAELHYTQNLTEQNKLTILLSESDIINPQLNGSDIDTFYNHKEVMRDFITNTQGDLITQPTDAGRVVRKIYKTVLNAAWNTEHLNILAYVHQSGTAKTIYQGKEIEVQ